MLQVWVQMYYAVYMGDYVDYTTDAAFLSVLFITVA